ncbi:response regulator [Chitinophaga sp. HK235]|uniref:response regulator n=1 Tax=Chitinophaga sp. HK235 TaxID=2952571 RepID=UPI001BAC3047|nr:response regulator [Chitinophaga sp. HK235]
MKANILWIEKEVFRTFNSTLLYRFSLVGYALTLAKDEKQGWSLVTSGKYGVIIIGLEISKSLNLVKRIRQVDDHTPIMIIAQKKVKDGLLKSLEAGADSYIVKPLEPIDCIIVEVEILMNQNPEEGYRAIFHSSLKTEES